FLEVLAKRNDGFNEVETLAAPIHLYDTLYFKEEASGQFALFIEQLSGDRFGPPLSTSSDNLIHRALSLLRTRCSVRQGMSVRLVKRIPIQAGLGGGSSDAAAALAAGNLLWKLGLSRSELQELAAELGSDVPLFLEDRPVLCRGRGERIEPVEPFGPVHFAVVLPPEGLATPEVFGACRPAKNPTTAQPLIDALQQGDLHAAGKQLHNQLQPAAESLTPTINRMKSICSGMDSLGHAMSGSGTSYFVLCRSASHARRVAARLRACRLGNVLCVCNVT
ncbi:MAG: 4-(cytidine 5'-diphospho)-2-C-methyl-D-erythritol kinase, partial [Planctomycetales bacterium]